MEALFFRSLAKELPPLLIGRRVERIHSPQIGWWTLRLQPCELPRFLLFAHLPSPCALVLAQRHPENPLTPTAQVMWLRKRIQGLRIIDVHADWSSRKLALGLGLRTPESWMILDAHVGISLETVPPQWQVDRLAWPSLAEIRENPNIWQSFPHISPLLRKTLALLPEPERLKLYTDLQHSEQHNFYVYESDHGPQSACPWRLPAKLCQGLRERQTDKALEAAKMLAESIFFPPNRQTDAISPSAQKKRKRLMQHLEADEQRMAEYLKLADQAQLLRAGLYQLSAHKRLERVTLAGLDGEPQELALNPQKTILENMEHWFRLADKGKRGLAHVRRRREQMLSEESDIKPYRPSRPFGKKQPTQAKPRKASQGHGLPMHRFLSSDGFTMLRGKNQKANHALLTKAASPFDYWFHADQGPGAHVILKRDSPEQEVPEQSMREAAVLAGLASHFSGAGRASVICAEVKHVQAVKGSPGLARVEKAHCTLLVDLDPELESRLKAVPT